MKPTSTYITALEFLLAAGNTHQHVYKHIHEHACIHVHTHAHTQTYAHIYIHTYSRTYTPHTLMHIHTSGKFYILSTQFSLFYSFRLGMGNFWWNLGKNFPKIKEKLPRKAIVSVNCQDVWCVYMCVCVCMCMSVCVCDCLLCFMEIDVRFGVRARRYYFWVQYSFFEFSYFYFNLSNIILKKTICYGMVNEIVSLTAHPRPMCA